MTPKDFVPKRFMKRGRPNKEFTREAPDHVRAAENRPELIIDWEEVKKLLRAGCTQTEVAGAIGISLSTLKAKTEATHGIPLSYYAQEHRKRGEAYLRLHQYEKAIGTTKDGDNTLLIWLGKVRLQQKEPTEKREVSPELVKGFEGLMNEITKMQEKS
jgi:hypothetical protein